MSANVASYVVARGLPAIVNFAAIAVYTRLLSPAEYGRYAVILAWALLACAVSFDWLAVASVRLLSLHRETEDVFLRSVLEIFVVLAAASGALIAVLGLAGAIDLDLRGVALVVVLSWANAYHSLNSDIARARFRPMVFGVLANVRAIGGLALGVGFVLLGWGGDGIVAGIILAIAGVSVWAYRTQWTVSVAVEGDRSLRSEVLRYGLPLAVSYILLYVMSTSDRLLIDWMLGSDDAGRYAAGYDIPKQLLGTTMMILTLAGLPLAAQAHDSRGREAARQELSRNLSTMLAVAVPAAVGMTLLAEPLAAVVFGDEFAEAAGRMIPWVAGGTLLWGIKSFHVDYGFALSRRLRGQVISAVVGAVINIGCNLAWIPRYGLMGAAYATVVAYAAALAVAVVLVLRVFPLPINPDLSRLLLATGGMAAVVLSLLRIPAAPFTQLVLCGCVGAVVFVILAIALDVAHGRRALMGIRSRIDALLKERR